MLFTRCPACDTTFRVTNEALTKAGGQVRCGRCANVFNAHTELRETVAQGEATPAAATAPPAAVTPSAPVTPSPAATPSAVAANIEKPKARETRNDGSFDELSVAAVVAQVKVGVDDSQSEHKEPRRRNSSSAPLEPAALSVEQVQQVLEDDHDASATSAIWALENPLPATRTSGWWRLGALLAVLALGVQSVHHFRSELAGQAVIGSWVQQAYGMMGAPVSPRWDIGQYQILDWIATAEPNSRGQGTLQIAARIHNRGPQPQPYPHVRLQLKDRWEEVVSRRVFDPAKYLGASATASDLMRAGDTVQAQLDVVDPGPDAYGFELDVCVEVETDVLTCGNDEIFL